MRGRGYGGKPEDSVFLNFHPRINNRAARARREYEARAFSLLSLWYFDLAAGLVWSARDAMNPGSRVSF